MLFDVLRQLNTEDINFVSIDDSTCRDASSVDLLLTFGFTGLSRQAISMCEGGRVPLISIWDDLHYHTVEARQRRHRLFGVAAQLLLPYGPTFLDMQEYKAYHEKAIFFPWFVPDASPEHTTPEVDRIGDRILLTGRVSDAYPLRKMALAVAASGGPIDILDHPGYQNRLDGAEGSERFSTGARYWKRLSEYRASLVLRASPDFLRNYTLAKFFEVPGAGTLLVATPTPDMAHLGFEDGFNFVSIWPDQINAGCITEILHDPNISRIAAKGRELILMRHTITARVRQILEVLRCRYV